MYVKPFNQGRLEQDNGLITHYETSRTDRVRKIRLIVVPVKLRQVVMSACHVSPLAGKSHDQIILFSIMERFWWPVVNKDLDQFIRACAYYQLAMYTGSYGISYLIINY